MKRFALFVGINAYPGNRLHCARADAEVLHKEFSRHYDVAKLLVDKKATPDAIVGELDALQKKAKAGDMLLFFFSGHGSDHAGEHVLAVPDFDRHGDADGVEGISTADLRHATNVKGLHRLFVLDCCRSRLFDDELRLQAKAASKSPMYLMSANRKAVLFPTMLSSSGPGQQSYENDKTGHGYFTEAFLEAIRDSDVSSFNAFRERIEVAMARPKKRPGMQNPYFEGPLAQIFLFGRSGRMAMEKNLQKSP